MLMQIGIRSEKELVSQRGRDVSDERDYLRSLGFTVGERGRFSKEMLDALANRKNAQTQDDMDDVYDYLNLPRRNPVRQAQELYGYTLEGKKVGFIMCFNCAEHMMWCECPDGIMAPITVRAVKIKEPLVRLHHSHV